MNRGSLGFGRINGDPITHLLQALELLKRDGTTEKMDDALTTFKERDKVVGLDEWQQLEKQYLALNQRS